MDFLIDYCREVLRLVGWIFFVLAVVNTVLIIRTGERVLATGYGDISVDHEMLRITLTGVFWYLWAKFK